MRFQLLGHVQGWVGDDPVSLGVRKQRFVLALLALEVNRLVPATRLVDLVWPDSAPASARAMIHTYISGLRGVLDQHVGPTGGIALISEAAGYELRCDPNRVDAHRFRDLVTQAREEPDDERRLAALTDALALWRGPALAGVTTEATRARLCGHLEEARLVATEDRAEAALRTGQHRQLVDELIGLAGLHPQRQRLTGQLMLALHRCGRAAEALRVYEQTRRELAEELGLDPGDELQRLHKGILRDDPDLASPPTFASAPAGELDDEPPGRPRQLPADLAVFTGREAELESLYAGPSASAAPHSRTVTIIVIDGMAGIGKTALAVHAAHRLADGFPDGQVFIDLHGFTPGTTPVAPGDALDRMLRAFGVPGKHIPDGLEDRAALWRTTLAGRRVLLLLDNAAGDDQVMPLLPGSGGCLVLVTSRRQLTGLDDAVPIPLDLLPTAEAIALFARISRIGETAVGPDSEARSAAAEIVELCGRLPLAIAIAAARLRSRPGWTAEHIAERLGDERRRLSELDVGQRSVTAAIEMSYQQLGEDQRRLFRLFGLHSGQDIDTYAVAALAGLEPPAAELLLEDLVDARLLQEPRPGRYQPHDLVRAFAARSAQEAEPATERGSALTRLLDHYRYAAWLSCEVLYPPDQSRRPRLLPPATALPAITNPVQAGSWLDSERANLLTAAAYAAANGWPRHTLHLSEILERHYEVRSQYADAAQLHGLAVTTAVEAGDEAGEARARCDLAEVYRRRGRYDESSEHLRSALAIYERIGEPSSGPAPRSGLGLVALRLGRYDEAQDHFKHALEFYRRTGDQSGLSYTLINLGILSGQTERWAEAEGYFREALQLSRTTGNRASEGHALTNLSIIFGASERYPEAIDHLGQALAVHRETRNTSGEADTLANLGLVYDRMGEPERALAHHEPALEIYRHSENRGGELESLNDIGRSLSTLGRLDEAEERHREAERLAISTGDRYQLARVHDGLGHVLHARGDTDDARLHWQQALDLLTELGLSEEAETVRTQLEGLAVSS